MEYKKIKLKSRMIECLKQEEKDFSVCPFLKCSNKCIQTLKYLVYFTLMRKDIALNNFKNGNNSLGCFCCCFVGWDLKRKIRPTYLFMLSAYSWLSSGINF